MYDLVPTEMRLMTFILRIHENKTREQLMEYSPILTRSGV